MHEAQRVLAVERCRRDAHHFIFGGELCTKDEHDVQDPIKPFPDLPYLRVVLDALLVSGRFLRPEEARFALAEGYEREWLQQLWESSLCFLEKSRQMMASWIVVAYLLWRAKYHPHQLILVQSKREEDAAALVYNKEPYIARMSFLEHQLPKHLRTLTFPRCGAYCHLFVPNGSHVWGIPEGGDIIRSNTASVLFSDEAGFQPEFEKAFSAAKPSIMGGGQLIAVSSAEPGMFQAMVEAA